MDTGVIKLKKNDFPKKGNYNQSLDRKLWNFYTSLGDADLGDFEPSGGVYRQQAYDAGEVPLAVLGNAIGYNLSGGLGYDRIRQLGLDEILKIRRTGKYTPTFVSLLVDDRDEYLAQAGRSRKMWARLKKTNRMRVYERASPDRRRLARQKYAKDLRPILNV